MMTLYNNVRKVPQEAMKTIGGGRLKGMTDINPMWRIKTLTEQFGACGDGWKYTITDKRLEHGANGEIAAFVDIELQYRIEGQWSDPIPGTGGSMFVTAEKNGLYTSDECYKMAMTDALSVACKALGVGADVYWDKDKTKYSQAPESKPDPKKPGITKTQAKELEDEIAKTGTDISTLMAHYKVNTLEEMAPAQYANAMTKLKAKAHENNPAK